MTDSESPATVPTPGEVFAFPLERSHRYGACQVVAVDESEGQATVAVLAWTGTAVPDVAALAGVPRMVRNFMFWQPEELLKKVPLSAPASYRRIGTLPVTGETVSRSYDSWDFGRDVERQARWDSIPSEITAAFKAVLDSEDTATTPGLHDRSGGPYEARLGAARSFSDDAGYRIGEDFRMESLRAWPALYQVTLHSWRDDLLPFLESSPLVKQLTLTGHGRRELDFSRTSLDRLSLDITGLERLVLPESLDLLILHGAGAVHRFDSLDGLLDELSGEAPAGQPMLQVVAEQAGRWITVHGTGGVPPVCGLDRVQGLRIGAIEDLDLADVSECFPNVSWLHLFGAPGLLSALSELRALVKLETLWICDLFGYAPDDFPTPDQLPALRSLDLDSVPADVAARVRALYKKAPGVALTVRKPRKPEWLAENLENPLRRWDGREGIPDAVSKKASAAFIAALRRVREADGSRTDEAGYTESVTAAVLEFLDVIAGLDRKRRFLYTLERDEVIDAVNALTAGLSSEASHALEPRVEAALDD
ncbi:hypothetical protein [Nannocystis punicea]|uniref:Gliding motility protein n=1 Tax=Nannocystis punicea TaxID=2995304 RepID=A0ABY7GUC4_9BACT|nr:hypothetical protein [Nannocystis poenicansa]WAS90566.1 hypothetical protein O0S08_30635 [Nannocystis poenicansa]